MSAILTSKQLAKYLGLCQKELLEAYPDYAERLMRINALLSYAILPNQPTAAQLAGCLMQAALAQWQYQDSPAARLAEAPGFTAGKFSVSKQTGESNRKGLDYDRLAPAARQILLSCGLLSRSLCRKGCGGL